MTHKWIQLYGIKLKQCLKSIWGLFRENPFLENENAYNSVSNWVFMFSYDLLLFDNLQSLKSSIITSLAPLSIGWIPFQLFSPFDTKRF